MTIEGAGLAVGIGLVLVGIEHLDFVAALQVNTAVAATLAIAFDLGRRGPLDVELDVTKLFPGADAAGGVDFHRAVLEDPFRFFSSLGALPFGKVLSIEENDAIGRRFGALAWRDYRRFWFGGNGERQRGENEYEMGDGFHELSVKGLAPVPK